MGNIFLDLNNQAKSKVRAIVGGLFILLGIANFTFLQGKEEIGIIQLITPILFSIVGLIHVIDGSGSRLKDKFGKRFIRINEKEIVVKFDFWGKALELEWENIQSMRIKHTTIEFTTKNNRKEKISIARLDYKQIKELKEYIKSISSGLNIEENENRLNK